MQPNNDLWALVVTVINQEFVRTGEPLTVPLLQQLIKAAQEVLTD